MPIDMSNQPINLASKLASFRETWTPKIIAELNGQHVKLAKLEGQFVWHDHANEDELFLVLEGELTMQMRDREVKLAAGDLYVVPRGVEHNPVAGAEGCSVLLFEPAQTRHTGSVEHERTVPIDRQERI
ncbi:MAG: cupin domain-containing protein [Planctomycetota bacterium]